MSRSILYLVGVQLLLPEQIHTAKYFCTDWHKKLSWKNSDFMLLLLADGKQPDDGANNNISWNTRREWTVFSYSVINLKILPLQVAEKQ